MADATVTRQCVSTRRTFIDSDTVLVLNAQRCKVFVMCVFCVGHGVFDEQRGHTGVQAKASNFAEVYLNGRMLFSHLPSFVDTLRDIER